MTTKILRILGLSHKNQQPDTDFSRFFHGASSREKKRVLTEAVRQANAEQRALVEAYRKTTA